MSDWRRRLLEYTKENNRLLHVILRSLGATHIHIKFHGGHTMPVTLAVGQSVAATASESNAAGPVAITDAPQLAWTSSDPTIVAETTEADGSASFTAVAAGDVTVTVTDPANGLTATDTITVTASPATDIAIAFGSPA